MEFGDGEQRIIQIILKHIKSKENCSYPLTIIGKILIDLLTIQHLTIPRAFCQIQIKNISISLTYKNSDNRNKDEFIVFFFNFIDNQILIPC